MCTRARGGDCYVRYLKEAARRGGFALRFMEPSASSADLTLAVNLDLKLMVLSTCTILGRWHADGDGMQLIPRMTCDHFAQIAMRQLICAGPSLVWTNCDN